MPSTALLHARPRPVREQPGLPVGGACFDQPDAFHAVGAAIGARAAHICLKHCPALEQCRAYAARYDWLYVVVAGQHWLIKNGERVVSATPPSREGCTLCPARPWEGSL